MAYVATELRLLTDRLVADGMNHWVYDTPSSDTLATVIAANYITNALKALATPGVGMQVGDKVTVRRFTSTAKTAVVSITEHFVTEVSSDGATLSAANQETAGTATATAGAATLNADKGKITSEALTTAQDATYTLTITNDKIVATDIVMVSIANGTNTQGTPTLLRVTPGASSIVVVIANAHASAQALNGTLVVSFAKQ